MLPMAAHTGWTSGRRLAVVGEVGRPYSTRSRRSRALRPPKQLWPPALTKGPPHWAWKLVKCRNAFWRHSGALSGAECGVAVTVDVGYGELLQRRCAFIAAACTSSKRQYRKTAALTALLILSVQHLWNGLLADNSLLCVCYSCLSAAADAQVLCYSYTNVVITP